MGYFIFNETKSLVFTKSDIEGVCVYVFWLGNVCQYVGSSSVGLSRPLAGNHSARKKPGFDYDRVEVFQQEDHVTALELEKQWIYKLSPIHNDVHVNPQDGSLPIKSFDERTKEFIVLSKKNGRGRNSRVELFRSSSEQERDSVWREERKRAREEHNAEFKHQEREREKS